MTQIEIGNILLDCEIDFAATYQLNDMKEIASRQLSYTYTIDVPGTRLAHEVFASIYDLQVLPFYKTLIKHAREDLYNESYTPFSLYDRTPARILVDGYEVFSGSLILEEVEVEFDRVVSYKVRLIGHNAPWAELSRNLKLKDIFFENFCWEFPSVTGKMTISPPFTDQFWTSTLTQYGNLQFDYPSNSRYVDINDLFPDFFVLDILKKGYRQLGLQFYCPLLEEKFYDLILLFSNENFVSVLGTLGSFIYEAETTTMTLLWSKTVATPTFTANHEIGWDVVTHEPEDSSLVVYTTIPNPYGPPSDDLKNIFINSPTWACGRVCVNVKVNLTLFYDYVTGMGAATKITAQVRKGGVTSTVLYSQTYTFGFSADETVGFDFDQEVCLDPGEYIYLYFGTAGNTNRRYSLYLRDALIQVFLSDFKKENLRWSLSSNLPDLTLLELTSDIMRMFNLYPYFFADSLTLLPYDEFFLKIDDIERLHLDATQPALLDIRDRVDMKSIKHTFLANEFAKEFVLSYQDDSDTLLKAYKEETKMVWSSYKVINHSSNATGTQTFGLNRLRSALTRPLLGELSHITAAFLIDKKISELPAPNATAWKPCIMRFRQKSLTPGNEWVLNFNNATALMAMSIAPLAHYDGITARELYNGFYRNEIELILKTRLISCAVHFKTEDILNFSFRKPVNFYRNIYGYITKIQGYNPSKHLTQVEIIQIL